MYFADSSEGVIYADLFFSKPLNSSSFDQPSFQLFSFSDSTLTNSFFQYDYQWLDTQSYRIIIQPSGYAFINNCTVTMTITSNN